MLRLASRLGGILGALIVLPVEARACSVCIGWRDGQGPNWGYYWSWLLLTVLPFVLAGIIGAIIGYALRRPGERRREREG